MKTPCVLAFSLVALSAFAQSPRINVQRPAQAYEVIDAIPAQMSAKADRARVADFLDRKQQAKADFIKEVRRACVPLTRGDLSVLEFARALDAAVARMREVMSSAYDRMSSGMSDSGRSALQEAARQNGGLSADTVAADIVVAAPAEADALFSLLCDKSSAIP